MVSYELAEASAELNELLKYFPTSYVEKIPFKLRCFFEKIAIKNPTFKIDAYHSLKEQNLKEKTKDLIAILYRNYWCSENERISLDKKLNINEKEHNEKIRNLYNPDKIFDKRKNRNNK